MREKSHVTAKETMKLKLWFGGYLQGNHEKPFFLGGAGVRPSTVLKLSHFWLVGTISSNLHLPEAVLSNWLIMAHVPLF